MYFAYTVIMQYRIKVNTAGCCRDGFPYYYDAIKWVYDTKMWADEYRYFCLQFKEYIRSENWFVFHVPYHGKYKIQSEGPSV